MVGLRGSRCVVSARGIRADADRKTTMINGFLIIYGIALIVGIIVLLDWLGRRKDRQSKHRPAA
jgi:hypothetical protein